MHRVWTAAASATSSPALQPGEGRAMEGREVKTRQGNRQWVARGVTVQASAWMRRKRRRLSSFGLEEGDLPGRKKRKSCSESERKGRRKRLVSIEGRKFVVSSGGRKLRRVSSSDTSELLVHLSRDSRDCHVTCSLVVTGTPAPKRPRLPSDTPTKSAAVKRMLAR